MIRHGHAPFLECSSRGDSRFSAMFAVVRGKTIEHWYQDAKILEDGVDNLTWREKKGLPATNIEECHKLYSSLWDEYIEKNPKLLEILLTQTGLSDKFGKQGHACQATELWRIRKKHMPS